MSQRAASRNPLRIRTWGQWASKVTDAYMAAPLLDEAAVPSYKAFIGAAMAFWPKIAKKVRVAFVDGQPYADEYELRADVASGHLRVSRDFNVHPLFTSEQNLRLRAVHDWLAHVLPATGGAHTAAPGFDQKGEIRAFNAHLKTLSPKARGAGFTEVIAQAMVYTTTGEFPVQKVCLLPMFDWYNLGFMADLAQQQKQLRQAGALPVAAHEP